MLGPDIINVPLNHQNVKMDSVSWDTVGAKHWGSGACGGVTQISQQVDGKGKTLCTLPKGPGDLGTGRE